MSQNNTQQPAAATVELDSVEKQLREIIGNWMPAALISRIEPLTPDASARRYFRIHFSAPLRLELPLPNRAGRDAFPALSSVVAMLFLSTAPAETGGGLALPSDQTYVELTALFREVGIPVPELFLDRRDRSILLIEDCGDLLLGDLLTPRPGASAAPSTPERILAGYYAAVSELVRFRRISPAPGHFLAQRRFTAELFYKEVLEFRDYYLTPQLRQNNRTLTEVEVSAVERLLSAVAKSTADLPTTTVHRDYHSWNLLVQGDHELRIRIIDFQDALQGPLHYDLVGLVNDRDTDALLGPENYRRIVDWYREAAKVDGSFEEQFLLASIQRDLKVAGRFGKLTERGVGNYQRWVPGTVRRLQRNLTFPFSDSKTVSPELKSLFGALAGILANADMQNDGV